MNNLLEKHSSRGEARRFSGMLGSPATSTPVQARGELPPKIWQLQLRYNAGNLIDHG